MSECIGCFYRINNKCRAIECEAEKRDVPSDKCVYFERRKEFTPEDIIKSITLYKDRLIVEFAGYSSLVDHETMIHNIIEQLAANVISEVK